MSTLLLVDDEPELLDIMRSVLEIEGHEVHIAADQEEALKILGRQKVDFLISDYRLPGGDTGVDLIKHARSGPWGAPRAVLITGFTGALEHHGLAEEIFYKPFNLQNLVGWIRQAESSAEPLSLAP